MAKRPYVKKINPNTIDSHQVSPGYMLTFIRFSNRDTFNYTTPPEEVRRPLVVYNDAVSVTVANSKQGVTASMSATLKAGDINYATAISAGDYVFVNMVDWDDKVSIIDGFGQDVQPNSLRSRAISGQAINKYKDGFKGVFKVQKVSKVLRTDPATGTKVYYFNVQAFGFTELNTVIYYDPQIYGRLGGNLRLFMQQFNKWWDGNLKKNFNIQKVIPTLINALLGQGRKDPNNKVPAAPITHFKLPTTVGSLLGIKGSSLHAIDMYNFYLGVWGSSKGGSSIPPHKGFNPNIKNGDGLPKNYFITKTKLQGNKVVDAEYWNNVKIWSIINKYSNSLINEMYTTFKVNPNGSVMPSLIIRQKPFSSDHFNSPHQEKDKEGSQNSNYILSKYMELPRWSLNPSLVYDFDLGKDEAARINFVQVYTRTVAANDARNRARQAGTGNFTFDREDIHRHGLKPFLATADYDYPEKASNKATKGKEWAELVSDWVINGHLREAGTITCQGIEEPISVGDNLEFNGIIYHIESVTHNVSIQPITGKKSFRTNLTVSFGTDPRSDSARPVYAEMEHTDSYKERLEDYENGERILPGFSDTQHIAGATSRRDGEEVKETLEKSYTLNPKPKSKEDRVVTLNTGETPKKDTKKD